MHNMSDRIVISADKLLSAFAFLDLIPQRAGIPSSDYIRVIAKKNYFALSMASEISGFASVVYSEGGWSTSNETLYWDRRLLFPFVQAGKGIQTPFVFLRDNKVTTIKQGNRQATFVDADEVAGYAQKVNLSKEGWPLPLSPETRELLAAAAYCSTNDTSVPHLNCVLVRNGHVYASNRTVVFYARLPKNSQIDKSFDHPFPVSTAQLLASGLIDNARTTETQVILINDSLPGQLQETASTFAKKDFPSDTIEATLKQLVGSPVILSLPAKDLSPVLDRIVGYMAGVRRQDWVLKLSPHPKGVICTCDVAQQGKFQELLVTVPQQFDEFEWPLTMVYDVIKYAAKITDQLVVSTDESKKTPFLLRDAEKTLVLMVARKV